VIDMDRAYLNVKEIDISEVGKGIAKIDPLVFEKIKLSTGDTIQITGSKSKKQTIAYAMKGKITDTGTNIIRFDASIRYNTGSAIDEEVYIEKIECHISKNIHLAPIISEELNNKENIKAILKELNRSDILSYIKNTLLHKNFLENNIVRIPRIGMPTKDGTTKDLQLIITKTNPKGPVRITEQTNIIISEKLETGFIGITYDDIGGLKTEIEQIREMVELPLRRPEVFTRLGITPPKGVLLYGAPGTGKTLLARAVASETEANFITINGPEIVSGVYGKSEENLRTIFKEAEEKAPSIIFIDEIDAIAPKRDDTHGDTEKRIVAQLLTLMDGLSSRSNVIVMATTNRPNSIDQALRRPGRFDREIEFGIPDKAGRLEILKVHTRGMRLDENVDLKKIIEYTNGFSGADLNMLCKEAALKTIKRLKPKIDKEINNTLSKSILDELIINQKDFDDALHIVEPSAIREVQVQIPNTKWEDIGGLENQKQELKEIIEWPIKYKDIFEQSGINAPCGVLLYGPPGTGKTLLAKAVASESNANFISIKGPEIFNKWVGESERKIRELFKKARQLAPSVIFFDEVDAITTNRQMINTSSGANNNVVAQLLTEIDGISRLKDIIIIGATNRIDLIDPAFLRPGRFDKLLYIPLPDIKSREKIFEVYLKKLNTEKNISAKELAKLTTKEENKNYFSGADIEAICNEAAMITIRKIVEKENANKKEKKEKEKEELKIEKISKKDFEEAIDKISKTKKREESCQEKINKEDNSMVH
jgi:transitional endoplasmic reticulum ATPase